LMVAWLMDANKSTAWDELWDDNPPIRLWLPEVLVPEATTLLSD
jgi:hypothetical protein